MVDRGSPASWVTDGEELDDNVRPCSETEQGGPVLQGDEAREGLPFPCEVSTASRSWCFQSPTAEAQPGLPTQLYSVSTLPGGPLSYCGIFTFGLGKILSNPPGHGDTDPLHPRRRYPTFTSRPSCVFLTFHCSFSRKRHIPGTRHLPPRWSPSCSGSPAGLPSPDAHQWSRWSAQNFLEHGMSQALHSPSGWTRCWAHSLHLRGLPYHGQGGDNNAALGHAEPGPS